MRYYMSLFPRNAKQRLFKRTNNGLTQAKNFRGSWIFSLLCASILLLCFQSLQAGAAPLPANAAFQLTATVKNQQTLNLHWDIAKGYHLYRERFCFRLKAPYTLHLESAKFPPTQGQKVTAIGGYAVFNGNLNVSLPLPKNVTAKPVTLFIGFQGCSDKNFCYPPMIKKVSLNLAQIGSSTQGETVNIPLGQSMGANNTSSPEKTTAETNTGLPQLLPQLLPQRHLLFNLLAFFGFGLLLSLTPCVLPMIPVLSSIILGSRKNLSSKKAFTLSLLYVLSMACTYAVAGIFAASLGQTLQSALQNPWIIGAFSVVFILLAFSLFDLYQLQIPAKWQAALSQVSGRQKSGSYIGVIVMGVLATLILSPCVTPPLVAVLTYIGQTGDRLLGGLALFVLALGMGVPLLLIGTSYGSIVPKTGPWMQRIKMLFGFLLIALAIWMLGRIVSSHINLLLWAIFFLLSTPYFGLFSRATNGWGQLRQGMGLCLGLAGTLLLVGFAQGNETLLTPLRNINTITAVSAHQNNALSFKVIHTLPEWKPALQTGTTEKKITLLDFYADWCVSCQAMDASTFKNPQVIAALRHFNLVRADISLQNPATKALMQHFQVFAPPTLVFFDSTGKEIKTTRLVGEVDASVLLKQLKRIQQQEPAKEPTSNNAVLNALGIETKNV